MLKVAMSWLASSRWCSLDVHSISLNYRCPSQITDTALAIAVTPDVGINDTEAMDVMMQIGKPVDLPVHTEVDLARFPFDEGPCDSLIVPIQAGNQQQNLFNCFVNLTSCSLNNMSGGSHFAEDC